MNLVLSAIGVLLLAADAGRGVDGGTPAQDGGVRLDSEAPLVLAFRNVDGENREYLEPLAVYSDGGWQRRRRAAGMGPAIWFQPGHDLRVNPSPTRFQVCGIDAMGYLLSGAAKGPFALSRPAAMSAFEGPGAALARSLRRLSRQRIPPLTGGGSKCPQPAAAELLSEPEAGFLGCARSAGDQRLCIVKQRWIHPGENQCSWVLRQEDWFVVRGGEMERIRATAVWGSEHGPSSIDPVLTLMLDGRVYVIARPECFEGCGGAVIVEVRGTKILPAIDAATDAVCG